MEAPRPALTPLIGAGGLQPWPSGGFVGAQSATAPRTVTFTFTGSGSGSSSGTGSGTEYTPWWLLVSPRILPRHDKQGNVRASTTVETRKPETRNNILDRQNQTKPPRQKIVNHNILAAHIEIPPHCSSSSPTRPFVLTCSPPLPASDFTDSFRLRCNCTQLEPNLCFNQSLALSHLGPDLDASSLITTIRSSYLNHITSVGSSYKGQRRGKARFGSQSEATHSHHAGTRPLATVFAPLSRRRAWAASKRSLAIHIACRRPGRQRPASRVHCLQQIQPEQREE